VAVVQSARDQGAHHVILTGDVANLGATSELREAKMVLDAYGYAGDRLTVVPGNHDVVNFRGVAEFRRMMCDHDWPYLARISDDVVVVAIDSTAHGAALDWRDMLSMNARGVFASADVARADALLASVPEGTLKILCFHHHPVDLPPDGYVEEFAGRLDRRLAGKAERSGALLDVAHHRGVGLILFGHRHRPTHHLFRIRGIPACCSGAVTEPTARGYLRYRVFDLDGPRIVRRRWIEVAPWKASSRVVQRTLESVSAVGDDDDLRVTQQFHAASGLADLELLRMRTRLVDRVVLDRVRRRLEAQAAARKSRTEVS
jgi:3',5'-cyclic AMP phosphodiesterase CpdA